MENHLYRRYGSVDHFINSPNMLKLQSDDYYSRKVQNLTCRV